MPFEILVPRDTEKLVVGEVDLLSLFHTCQWWRGDNGTQIEIWSHVPTEGSLLYAQCWEIGEIVPVWITMGLGDQARVVFDNMSFEVVEEGIRIDKRVSHVVRLVESRAE